MLMSREEPAEGIVKLLGDPLRARIVGLLAREQLCTCHLIDETGARQPTISHHLRVLREAGFVAAEPRGRFTYYRLRPDRVREVAEGLTGLADRAETAQQEQRPC